MSFSEHALPAALRSLGAVARFCVAYSGGLDSSVLLHALARCRDALGAPLVAVHVDHALLSEAAAWTAHCRATCAELGVPLQVVEVDAARRRAALGVEAAARDARYAALADLLGPGDCLLTAHHRDDQAETVLLQLLRGCGPAGLAAMPGVAPLGRGRLARPLLDVSRADLRAYAVEHSIGFVQDPSNSDPELARGFLRTEVTPRLQARWPGMSRTLARAARHAADAAAIIAERAAEDLERLTASTRGGCRSPRWHTCPRRAAAPHFGSGAGREVSSRRIPRGSTSCSSSSRPPGRGARSRSGGRARPSAATATR